MRNQRCDGWETQPRTVRKLAEASFLCQATLEVTSFFSLTPILRLSYGAPDQLC